MWCGIVFVMIKFVWDDYTLYMLQFHDLHVMVRHDGWSIWLSFFRPACQTSCNFLLVEQMLAIVVVSTWRWWSYVMVLDDMSCVEVMLSAKRRWRKKSMVLGASWRKGLYHITYIKLHVMLILFIACFDCALVVILIGWSLIIPRSLCSPNRATVCNKRHPRCIVSHEYQRKGNKETSGLSCLHNNSAWLSWRSSLSDLNSEHKCRKTNTRVRNWLWLVLLDLPGWSPPCLSVTPVCNTLSVKQTVTLLLMVMHSD